MIAECIVCRNVKEVSHGGWCESCSKKLDSYIERTGDDEGYFETEDMEEKEE